MWVILNDSHLYSKMDVALWNLHNINFMWLNSRFCAMLRQNELLVWPISGQ